MKNYARYSLITVLVAFTVACNSEKKSREENGISVKVASKEFTFDNPKVISVIEEYISQHSSGPPKVFTAVIQREDLFTTSLNLYVITWYSQKI